MAQNFCGSNNLNLLTPSGQFGTRRMGGKDAASARYIFTKLEPITRLIFHPDDDDLLTYLQDDGEPIEPTFYVPVIPMVLVNGAEGIGTGWSSSVNNYDPRDIVENLRRKLNGDEFKPLTPFYYGFTGDIVHDDTKPGSFSANGKIERIDDTTLHIFELPIRRWTQDFKIFLEKLLTGDGKTPPDIKDFRENHTDTTVSFTIVCTKDKIDEFEKEKNGLLGKFKLTGSLTTTNMNLFDAEGRITKFEDTRDILTTFFDLRLGYYDKRKVMLLEKLRIERLKLSNKARFVKEVCSGELIVSNRKRQDILFDLKDRGYDTFFAEKKKEMDSSEDEEDQDEGRSDSELAKGYDYLLGMKIWSLTFEKAEQLLAELAAKTEALEELEGTTPGQIWLKDLDAIEAALDDRDAMFKQNHEEEITAQKKNVKHRAKAQRKAANAKTKINEWDRDEDSSSDDKSDKKFNVAQGSKKQRAKPPAKPPASKKTVSLKSSKKEGAAPSSDPEDGFESAGLAERMQSRLHVSPPLREPSSKELKKRPASPVLEEAESAPILQIDPDSQTAKIGLALKKPAPSKKQSKKTKASKTNKMDDTSESEEDLDFKSDEEIAVVHSTNQPTRSRSARSRKAVVYALDEDSSDESSH